MSYQKVFLLSDFLTNSKTSSMPGTVTFDWSFAPFMANHSYIPRGCISSKWCDGCKEWISEGPCVCGLVNCPKCGGNLTLDIPQQTTERYCGKCSKWIKFDYSIGMSTVQCPVCSNYLAWRQ